MIPLNDAGPIGAKRIPFVINCTLVVVPFYMYQIIMLLFSTCKLIDCIEIFCSIDYSFQNKENYNNYESFVCFGTGWFSNNLFSHIFRV